MPSFNGDSAGAGNSNANANANARNGRNSATPTGNVRNGNGNNATATSGANKDAKKKPIDGPMPADVDAVGRPVDRRLEHAGHIHMNTEAGTVAAAGGSGGGANNNSTGDNSRKTSTVVGYRAPAPPQTESEVMRANIDRREKIRELKYTCKDARPVCAAFTSLALVVFFGPIFFWLLFAQLWPREEFFLRFLQRYGGWRMEVYFVHFTSYVVLLVASVVIFCAQFATHLKLSTVAAGNAGATTAGVTTTGTTTAAASVNSAGGVDLRLLGQLLDRATYLDARQRH